MPEEKDAADRTEGKGQPSKTGIRKRAKRRWPPLTVLILMDLLIGGVCVLQILAPSYDRALTNIYSWGLCVGAFALPSYWFTIHSAFPWRVRLMPLTGLLLGVGFCAARLEVRGWSGTFIPELHWRGSKRPDEQLEQPKQNKTLQISDEAWHGDFPQFLGPNRDLVVRNANLARNWQQKHPRKLWRQRIGAGWSAFSAVSRHAVTMEQRGPKELVVCYRVETG
ncbi:MAG: hypothetical protein IH991_07415, partial [Planctomycetes bacterium]|nr:hypothetical protein [Planctomycetota bacterium]